MRVTMHATTAEACGIADYTRDLLAGLAGTVAVRMVGITDRTVNPIRAVRVARQLNDADVTHIHHNYGFWGRGRLSYRLVFGSLQQLLRVPAVLTAHSVRPPLPSTSDGTLKRRVTTALGLDTFLDRGTFDFAERIVVHSRRHVRLLTERGIPRERVTEILPGVPALGAPPAAEVSRFRAQWGLESKTVLGLFGFIQPNKDCELLVHAAAELPEHFAVVFLGGVRTAAEQWYGARLRALIQTLGLDARVRITGFLPRQALPAALGAVDLFVLPYVADDSVSYSARLCLACDAPLLASAVDAFQELNERYACVELFRARRPDELAAVIAALARDDARRAAIVEGAKRYRQERTWARAARETVAVYEAAAGRRR